MTQYVTIGQAMQLTLGDTVGTQTRTRSNRKYTTKSPHTRNGRQSSMCHNCSINIH